MKKIIFIFSLLSILLASNAMAANYKISPYAGIDLGMNVSTDTSLFSVILGGRLHTNYGAEISYSNYGLSLNTSGFAFDAIGYFPTRHIIALASLGYGMQHGVIPPELFDTYTDTDTDTEDTLTTTDTDASTMVRGPRIGVGAQYRFTRLLSGRAMLRYSFLSEITNQIDLTFGLTYEF